MVPEEILRQYNGQEVNFNAREMIFLEGEPARYYWQVISGSVKMVNYSEDGQEFAQGIFNAGESFGEPPLFTGNPYPGSAVTIGESVLWKLAKASFIQLLQDNFELHLAFTSTLCQRLYYKATLMKEISSHTPEHRIITLIDLLKERNAAGPEPFEVPYTRQQLADMTGLRVETVIRTIKNLEKQGELKIMNRKVYR
jgi:CRP-like cAMP-binding protein